MNLEWKNNAIFAATDRLSFLPQYSGAGVFHYAPELVLTKAGYSRSKWNLPEIFKNIKISHHNEKSWRENYFQSVPIGQEFVWESDPETFEWTKKLILTGVKKSHRGYFKTHRQGDLK